VKDEIEHPEAAAATSRGRPGHSGSKPMLGLEPHQRSDEAMRRILLHQLARLRAAAEGVLEDADTVHLHDFRVATRRTRSALTQAKGVLPQPVIDEFAPRFKSLATLTGPCRDLDVNLLDLDSCRGQQGIHDDALDPWQQHLKHSRRLEHQRICRELRSASFRKFIDGWTAFLGTETVADPEPPEAGRPVIEVAEELTCKAFRRLVKRSSGLSDDPSAKQLHRLRIDAKKLRYLLEFFRSLYPAERVNSFIGELKDLQDVLGELNDREIQRERLTVMTRDLEATVGADTLAAMKHLASDLDLRHEELRHAFLDLIVTAAVRRECPTLLGIPR
jgi:CHAD domain-containing protein